MDKTISRGRKAYIGLMKTLMYLAAGITGALTLFLIVFVLAKGLPLSLIHISEPTRP